VDLLCDKYTTNVTNVANVTVHQHAVNNNDHNSSVRSGKLDPETSIPKYQGRNFTWTLGTKSITGLLTLTVFGGCRRGSGCYPQKSLKIICKSVHYGAFRSQNMLSNLSQLVANALLVLAPRSAHNWGQLQLPVQMTPSNQCTKREHFAHELWPGTVQMDRRTDWRQEGPICSVLSLRWG